MGSSVLIKFKKPNVHFSENGNLANFIQVLYTNIDLKLQNKCHGSMHYKIGVTYVFNEHV